MDEPGEVKQKDIQNTQPAQINSQMTQQVINAENAKEQIEENFTGPFGWLPRIFRRK